jgi:O-antigen/teichoic acid export membrane protein
MNKLKKLAGETVLYGFGSILPRMLNFFLVFLHISVFQPEEYGVITTLYAMVGVINIVYMFGMETAYFRFATKPGADEKRIFNLAQTAVIGISLVFTLVIIFTSGSIAHRLDIPRQYIFWFSAIMFIDAIVAIPFARLRLQKKPKLFALGKIANILILVLLNVYFLQFTNTPDVSIDFVFLANLVANAFYLVFFLRTFLQWRPAFDSDISRSMFVYAYPIMITGIAGMTNEMFSRMTLGWWLPENFYPGRSSEFAVGVFGACYKFSMVMNLTVQAFRFAAEPFFFSNSTEKNYEKLFARVNHYFIIVCCFILLAVSINLDILQYLPFDQSYWEGLDVVPVLLGAYLFLGIYYNTTIWFKLTDKTYFGTIITLGGAVVTIGLNYLLIPYLGYMGSSIAALACYLSMTIACYLLGQKYHPIPYRVKTGLLYIVSTIALTYVVMSIPISNPWLSTSFHLLIVLLYGIVVYKIEWPNFKKGDF